MDTSVRKTGFIACIAVLTVVSFVPSWSVVLGKPPSALESVLYDLTLAEDVGAFASSRGLYVKDGRVRVVVELVDVSAQLPTGFSLVEEARSGNLVQVMIPIRELVSLATEPAVEFIRAPLEAAEAQRSSDGSSSSSPFGIYLLTVSLITAGAVGSATLAYVRMRKK
jgi:hypothetical protein